MKGNISNGMAVYPRCDEHGTWDPALKSGCPECISERMPWLEAEIVRVRQRANRLETELCRIVAAHEAAFGAYLVGDASELADAVKHAATNLRAEGVEPNE